MNAQGSLRSYVSSRIQELASITPRSRAFYDKVMLECDQLFGSNHLCDKRVGPRESDDDESVLPPSILTSAVGNVEKLELVFGDGSSGDLGEVYLLLSFHENEQGALSVVVDVSANAIRHSKARRREHIQDRISSAVEASGIYASVESPDFPIHSFAEAVVLSAHKCTGQRCIED